MRRGQAYTLIEVLIATAIIGIVIVAFMGGLALSFRILTNTKNLERASDLAEAQAEYVKTLTYDYTDDPPVYTTSPSLDLPSGWTVVTTAARLDPKNLGNTDNDEGLQTITITIQESNKPLFTLVTEKVKW